MLRCAATLTDLDGLRRTVAALQPAAIVNAAAYTAVDKAESEPERAHRINAQAPVRWPAAAACRAWLVHYGTDFVFDGSGGGRGPKATQPGRSTPTATPGFAGEDAIRAGVLPSASSPLMGVRRARRETSPAPCCAGLASTLTVVDEGEMGRAHGAVDCRCHRPRAAAGALATGQGSGTRTSRRPG